MSKSLTEDILARLRTNMDSLIVAGADYTFTAKTVTRKTRMWSDWLPSDLPAILVIPSLEHKEKYQRLGYNRDEPLFYIDIMGTVGERKNYDLETDLELFIGDIITAVDADRQLSGIINNGVIDVRTFEVERQTDLWTKETKTQNRERRALGIVTVEVAYARFVTQ